MTKDFGKGKTANTISFLEAQKELKAFLEKNNFAKIPEEWIKVEQKEEIIEEFCVPASYFPVCIRYDWSFCIDKDAIFYGEEKKMDPKTERFLNAGGIIPGITKQPKKSDTTSKHFNFILSNDKPDTWVNEQGEIKIKDMHDKHLIATMRFLIRNVDEIKEAIIVELGRISKFTNLAQLRSYIQWPEIANINGYKRETILQKYVITFNNLSKEVRLRFN